MLGAVTGVAVRRPKVTLAAWAALVLVLGLAGRDVGDRLTQSALTIPGTESSAAIERYQQNFGDSVTMPVLLRGPAEALDRQGPALARALDREPGVRVLSAWDEAQGRNPLRPAPDRALLLPALEGDLDSVMERRGPRVRALVGEQVEPPVRAHVSGMAAIGADLQEASLDAGRSAERIAIPVLLLVLLLVFRSVVAAAIPALFGVATVVAGGGVLALLTQAVALNEMATSLASMMGLALGVDYSLLMVARFREELQEGDPARAAAATATATAGHTVLHAGIALLAAMAVAVVLSPGDLLVSAAAGVASVTVLSVLAAFTAVPAALALLGTRIGRGAGAGVPARAAERLLRRPAVALAALLALLALCAPAAALDTGPPDVGNLPADSRARQDFEALRASMGPGWAAPFDVVVVARDGPLTAPERLDALQAWQERVARLPGVASVIGPGALARQSERIDREERRLRRTQRRLREGRRDAQRLERGLGRAVGGVRRLRGGLARAGGAADRLAAGGATAAGGAAKLAVALRTARGGAERLRAGLAEAQHGAVRLAGALGTAARGARRLRDALTRGHGEVAAAAPRAHELAAGLREAERGLGRLGEPAGVADAEVARVYEALMAMSVGKADPQYVRALTAAAKARAALTGKDPLTGRQLDPRYPGLAAALREASSGVGRAAGGAGQLATGLDQLASGLGRLAGGAGKLRRGIRRLQGAAGKLAGGLERAEGGSGRLGGGLERLADGAGRLDAGLARLSGGTRRLGNGLERGAGQTGRLGRGLERARSGVERQSQGMPASNGATDRAPGLFDSGYFLLAAIDGARSQDAKRAEYAVSVERGGRAGRIVVVPESGPNDERTHALRDRLSREAERLERDVPGTADVGGAAALLADYDRVTSKRFPLLVLALSLVTFVVLAILFRALLLAAISVGLNLVTVGAAFGLLALLFQGDDPVLGGPGHIDAVSTTAMFTVIFGLSIDYQVFLISRMREGWLLTRDNEAAIAHGLQHTARVVTGAAAIMTGVFAAFALADIANIKQFGVGLAAAIVIDATVVRLLLLPAAMRAGGRWTWWMPSPRRKNSQAGMFAMMTDRAGE
jgi:RND superfamily putative drug exporter